MTTFTIVVAAVCAAAVCVTADAIATAYGRHSDSVARRPSTSQPARFALWGLAGGIGNRVELLVNTGCRTIAGTTETPHHSRDRIDVEVTGVPDCRDHALTAIITLTLKHGGFGCNSDSVILDAATDRRITLASGRAWPVFGCPAMAPKTPLATPRARSH